MLRLRRKALVILVVLDHGIRSMEIDLLFRSGEDGEPTDRIASLQVLSEPMTPENGLLTHTPKARRHVVAKRSRDTIAALFSS